jgi:hypothetical protein
MGWKVIESSRLLDPTFAPFHVPNALLIHAGEAVRVVGGVSMAVLAASSRI